MLPTQGNTRNNEPGFPVVRRRKPKLLSFFRQLHGLDAFQSLSLVPHQACGDTEDQDFHSVFLAIVNQQLSVVDGVVKARDDLANSAQPCILQVGKTL